MVTLGFQRDAAVANHGAAGITIRNDEERRTQQGTPPDSRGRCGARSRVSADDRARFRMKVIMIIFQQIIILVLLVGCSISDKSDRLNDFLGIPWGTSREMAKEVMLKRSGTIFAESESDDTTMCFYGGESFGKAVRAYHLYFTDGKLYSGSIDLHPATNGEVLLTYLELKKRFINEYGIPDKQKETFDPSKNSMKDLEDLRNDKGWLQASWDFPVSNKVLKNGLILLVIKGYDISVMYVNTEMGYARILKKQSTRK